MKKTILVASLFLGTMGVSIYGAMATACPYTLEQVNARLSSIGCGSGKLDLDTCTLTAGCKVSGHPFQQPPTNVSLKTIGSLQQLNNCNGTLFVGPCPSR
jgi:hypothetical protein